MAGSAQKPAAPLPEGRVSVVVAVVGAGHNGLVAACYLADAADRHDRVGARVVCRRGPGRSARRPGAVGRRAVGRGPVPGAAGTGQPVHLQPRRAGPAAARGLGCGPWTSGRRHPGQARQVRGSATTGRDRPARRDPGRYGRAAAGAQRVHHAHRHGLAELGPAPSRRGTGAGARRRSTACSWAGRASTPVAA